MGLLMCGLMSILFSKLLFFLVRIIQLHARAQPAWGSHDVHPLATRHERPWCEAAQCVFCLCDIEEGEEKRELRCGHLFHGSCLDRWLVRRRATCPLCRDVLLPREPATVKRNGGGAGDDEDEDEDELDDWTVMLFAYLRWWMP
ncbi:Zinc finger, C3HC4 type (RING finger) [Musa troglodytarum]|uniref:Zinc finger, C3HC4 type (RING finger) n=1 Tax=Musa troglodytarum TaxID=320322 RepID=A0A9E7K8J1_9LILI|nr:Zinc finger, C3HC4 type (RING finger) [Musa troglodytarum]